MTAETETPENAAAEALRTHDTLREVTAREPDSDEAPDEWVLWHDQHYRPAYDQWSAAMDALAAALHEPNMSRHPYNFRPVCERLIAEG